MGAAATDSRSGPAERRWTGRVRDAFHDRVFVSHRVDVVQRSMQRPVPEVRAKRDFEVVTVDDPGSPLLARLAGEGRTQAARNVAAGDVLFVALDGDELAAWVWYTDRSHVDPYGGIRMNLLPGEGYTYDLYAVPRYRPDGAAARVMQAMLGFVAADERVETVYSYVNEDNRESQLLLRMVFGFKSCQKATSVRLLNRVGLQMPFRTSPAGGPCSRRRTLSGEDAAGRR